MLLILGAPVVCLVLRKWVKPTRQGRDATIIAIGVMVAAALEAADDLKREGIDCGVLNMPTLKLIDEVAIVKAAANTGAIVTAEEHIVTAEEHLEHGGLGSLVAQIIARNQPVPMEFIATKDTYAKSGKAAELLERYGLTAKDIEQAVHAVLKKKQSLRTLI